MFYIILHVGHAIEVSETIFETTDIFQYNVLGSPFIFITTLYEGSYTVKTFILSVVAIFFIFVLSNKGKKKYMKGIEHGSARFATLKEMKVVKDKDSKNNIILTDNIFLSLNGDVTKRNKNVVLFGGAGTGKTRGFVKPNLMQMNSSYVITDPKGEILFSTGKVLEGNGYKIKLLNLTEMDKSDFYNPFQYIRNGKDEDVMTLIKTIMINTNGDKKGGGDPFWEKAEELFLQALFFYIIKEGSPHEKNMSTVMKLMRLIDIKEGDEDTKSPLDFIFDELAEKDSNHIAIKQYELFKLSAGKTAKSIVISAGARLSPYNINTLENISQLDNLELEKIGEEKTAFFVITDPTDPTFNFIASMMYTQLFGVLNYRATKIHGGRLPIPVSFILDEFANIGRIPNFEKILAYARGLNIGIVPIFQSLGQLKEMYKDSWEGILDNCDSFLFLGGQGLGTVEYVSKLLGKTTIDTLNKSTSRSKTSSRSFNEGIMARDLMTPTEIKEMNVKDCIVFIKGLPPYFGEKYNIEKHKNYKQLSDYNKDNTYKLELSKNKLENIKYIQKADSIIGKDDKESSVQKSNETNYEFKSRPIQEVTENSEYLAIYEEDEDSNTNNDAISSEELDEILLSEEDNLEGGISSDELEDIIGA